MLLQCQQKDCNNTMLLQHQHCNFSEELQHQIQSHYSFSKGLQRAGHHTTSVRGLQCHNANSTMSAKGPHTVKVLQLHCERAATPTHAVTVLQHQSKPLQHQGKAVTPWCCNTSKRTVHHCKSCNTNAAATPSMSLQRQQIGNITAKRLSTRERTATSANG